MLAAHGIAGITGILFIGLLRAASRGTASPTACCTATPGTLVWQAIAVLATPVYAFAVTYVLLKLVGAVMPLRATDHEQAIGIDVDRSTARRPTRAARARC